MSFIHGDFGCQNVAKFSSYLLQFSKIFFSSKVTFMFKIDIIVMQIVSFLSIILLEFYIHNFEDIFKEILISACHVIEFIFCQRIKTIK